MLVAVVFFFFACIMPFKVLTLWIVTSPTEVFDYVSMETYFNLVSHLPGYFSMLTYFGLKYK